MRMRSSSTRHTSQTRLAMGGRMRDDEVAEIRECFAMFDRDNDGKIPCQELGTVVRSLGNNPTEADIEDVIKNQIRGGQFGLQDLVQVVGQFQTQQRDKEDEIREAFRVFDRDGAGYVSAAELRHIMTNIGEKLTDQEVDEMIQELSVDNDGQFNYEEVVMMMVGK